MIYIDFDGVILDTEKLLFEEWEKDPERFSYPESQKIEYMQKADWEYIVNNSAVINDSIYNLQHMDLNNTAILTKVHSLSNEASAKTNWLRTNNIKQNVIIVPYNYKKTDIVNARHNILIDDYLNNLDDWAKNDGYPIFFDHDNDNYDSWQQPNVKCYKKILSLSSYTKNNNF